MKERRRLLLALAAAIAAAAIAVAAAPARADILAGGAATRGVFGWEALGGYERTFHLRAGLPISIPARVEGHFTTRDNLTNVVLSNYLLLRLEIPGFDKVDFGPYVATGPGLHLQGTWSDLQSFGDVLVQGETALKWHILVGATLVRGARADLVTEARYSKPGPYDFDYVSFGLRIHPLDPSRRRHQQ